MISLGGSDCCDQVNSMCVISPLLVEFKNDPIGCQSRQLDCENKVVSSDLFGEYFRHQIHHMVVQRRMQTSLQSMLDCCLLFGAPDCCQVDKDYHCCCKMKDSIIPINQSRVNTESCPCDKQEQGDRRCEVHGLFIQGMELSEKGCIWTINLTTFATKELDNPDKCFGNPCYDELYENVLDDSFEIEFTTTASSNEMESSFDSSFDSFDSFDFTNIHFCCDQYDGGDEFIDIYDYVESDVTSMNYESSDDDEDCCEIFNSGFLSPTWNTNMIIANRNTHEQKKAARKAFICNTLSHEGRTVSKYHTNCTAYTDGTVVAGNNNKPERVTMEIDKLRKKVHFPEPGELVTVHHLLAWAHAYKESRKSKWSIVAQDRAHFRRRVMNMSAIIDPVLKQKLSQISFTDA